VIAIDIEGDGPPLALIHGVGTSRVVWRHVVAPLAATRQVGTLDLPGFGSSPPLGPGFELAEVADALADALRRRLDAPFDLLGHSLGGAVALTLATRHPRVVRRLLLLAPAGFTQRPAAVLAAAGALGAPLLAARRTLGKPLAGNPLARRALLWGAVADGGRLSAADAPAMLDASRGTTRFAASVRAVGSASLWPLLDELRAPLGLIWGERDRVASPRALGALRASAPQAVVETIAESGHVPQMERPLELVAAVNRLLDGLGSAAAA
jgi:pimeloyl-ACP methyl ester carboxylesterase